MRNKLIRAVFGFVCAFSVTSVALAEDSPDQEQAANEQEGVREESLGARIASYNKIGRVVVDGHSVYISKGIADIVEEEGEVNLVENDNIQCRTTMRTGSHITVRICRTRAEWKDVEEKNRNAVQNLYQRDNRPCAEAVPNVTGGAVGGFSPGNRTVASGFRITSLGTC